MQLERQSDRSCRQTVKNTGRQIWETRRQKAHWRVQQEIRVIWSWLTTCQQEGLQHTTWFRVSSLVWLWRGHWTKSKVLYSPHGQSCLYQRFMMLLSLFNGRIPSCDYSKHRPIDIFTLENITCNRITTMPCECTSHFSYLAMSADLSLVKPIHISVTKDRL